MNTKRILSGFVISLFFFLNGLAQTADEIIQKNIDATGGKSNWETIKTMKVTGYVGMGGMDFAITQYTKAPDKSLLEIIIQGMTMKQGYDGTTGWMINPMMGSKKPENVDDETAIEFKERGNIGGRLMNYKDEGTTAELLGKEDLEGTEVFKIKLTEKSGKVINYFFDTKNYMVLKEKQIVKRNGKEYNTETTMSNYKTVNNVQMPYTMEINTEGSQIGSQTVTLDKIEMNVDIDDNIFKMPAE